MAGSRGSRADQSLSHRTIVQYKNMGRVFPPEQDARVVFYEILGVDQNALWCIVYRNDSKIEADTC